MCICVFSEAQWYEFYICFVFLIPSAEHLLKEEMAVLVLGNSLKETE
jgi:hypothetical protein